MPEETQAPPQQQQLPPSPQAAPELSPADRKLAEEGGELIPGELRADKLDFDKIKPIIEQTPSAAPTAASDSPQKHVIDVTTKDAPLPPGEKPPAPPSAEEIAFKQGLSSVINFEMNVLNVCYGAVHNLVAMRLQMEPPDSAELGQSMFGAGVRTPIEIAEPHIALEVYRQVRQTMREENTKQVKPGFLRRALRAVFGQK
jgi:hypothetical protein